MSDTATPALDAPELPLSDYRALREGRSVERVPVADMRTSEAPPAGKPPAADAESGAESETADDTELEASEEGQQQQQQEKKPGAGKRGLVDELIKLRRENRELKTRGAPPPSEPQQQTKQAPPVEPAKPAAAPADDPEPDIKKYSDYDKFNRDLVRWEIRQSQRQAAAEAENRAQQEQARAVVNTWQQRVSAASAKNPDYEAVAFNSSLPITGTMGDAIMRSEIGPDVLYHLGANPSEAERISKLSPIDQVREIGKLEVKLTPSPAAESSDEDEPTPKQQAISKAPPPIPRPAGSGTKSTPSLRSLEGISQSEYRALRESGKLR